MSERYIVIPPPAVFIDSVTKEPVLVKDAKGKLVTLPDRPFDWFMHVYMLSHLQFSMEVGGYDAAKAGKSIARALDKAIDNEQHFFSISADNWRRLNCCIARPKDEDSDELLKPKPNPKVLAKSIQGMARDMDNFTAYCFMEHMDAIANASTNEPEAPQKKVAAPPEPASPEPESAQAN